MPRATRRCIDNQLTPGTAAQAAIVLSDSDDEPAEAIHMTGHAKAEQVRDLHQYCHVYRSYRAGP